MSPLPVVSPEQSEQWDRLAESAGIELMTLMEVAGRGAATVIAARFPELLAGGVLVATGTGNNGGDGWVIARALHRLDLPVWVAALTGTGSTLQLRASALAQQEGVRLVAPDGPWPAVALIVDAILGTGARGAPRAAAAALVERINDLGLPVVSIDGPTGVDMLTGASHGASIRARLSVTFGGPRRGHLLARDETGDLIVIDIGHPPPMPEWPALMTDLVAAATLPRFHASDHKGVRGRVVVVGGDAGMSGAIRLAGRAAFGGGAGLVFAATSRVTADALVAAEPDLQVRTHSIEGAPSDELRALVTQADALVIGPGLGRGPGKREFVHALVRNARAVVIDADALVAFAGALPELRAAVQDRFAVLTPHPGEFRALFPHLAGEMELDPWAAAASASDEAGCVLLLKGVPTVVAATGKAIWTLAAGNPGLATGGSGDILSGLVGALLGQHLDPVAAASTGAQILGRAAELAARRTTARGLRPMDVVAALPDLWRTWEALLRVRSIPRPPVLLELERPLTT